MSLIMKSSNLIGFNSPSPQSQTRWNDRLTAALRKPLYERCFELNNLFLETIQSGSRESQMYYTGLVDDIFAMNRVVPGWGVKTICKESHPSDYDCIFTFLKPDNPFFNWIRFLMTDHNFKCEFPVTYLKPSVQTVISSGVVPNYLGKKMNQTQNGLVLDPLEYFWFSFFVAIQSEVVGFQRAMFSNENSNSLPVYIPLLESYLNYFLPLKSNQNSQISPDPNQSQPSIWHSLSATTSNLLHLGSSNVSSPRMSTPRSSLLNVRSLLDQSRSNTNATHPMGGSEVTVCEEFLNVIAELLLDIPDRSQVKKSRSPLNRGSVFVPTQDYMRCVRVIVKHLHYFSNSAPGKDRQNVSQYREAGSLDDIKRNIWTSKLGIQKRLYNLFRISFDVWPSDASFRLPLETWLSYIQPWRYVPGGQPNQSRGNEESDQLTSIVDDWLPFISDNLSFYNTITLQVMSRFVCFDLSSVNNALMLNRVTKIFAHPNLDRLIKRAESSINRINSVRIHPSNRHSLFSPSRSPVSDIDSLGSKHHLQECEDANFETIPLFSSRASETITEVMREINLAKAVVADELKVVSSSNIPASEESFLDGLKSFFSPEKTVDVDFDRKCKELKRIESYLTNAENRMREIFNEEICGRDIVSDPTIIAAKIRQRHLSSPSSANKKPDSETDQFGTPKLTTAGRKQLLNRMAKPDIHFEGNPDVQPTRSFEVHFMVMILTFLSRVINDKIGLYIDRAYQSNLIFAKIMKLFVAAPVTYTVTIKRAIGEPCERVTNRLPARINLRFLANKSILYGIISCIIFKWLFNFGYIFLICSIILILVFSPSA